MNSNNKFIQFEPPGNSSDTKVIKQFLMIHLKKKISSCESTNNLKWVRTSFTEENATHLYQTLKFDSFPTEKQVFFLNLFGERMKQMLPMLLNLLHELFMRLASSFNIKERLFSWQKPTTDLQIWGNKFVTDPSLAESRLVFLNHIRPVEDISFILKRKQNLTGSCECGFRSAGVAQLGGASLHTGADAEAGWGACRCLFAQLRRRGSGCVFPAEKTKTLLSK